MNELVLLSATDARVLTDRIKVGVEAVWELIIQAYTERAWQALGHSSWDDYCTREFGATRLRLPREQRSEVVGSLRDAGLSIRAIASATGSARNTVRDALRAQVGQIDPPANQVDVDPDELADELIAAEPQPITGTDGKSYPPSNRQRPSVKRRPITDVARDLGLDIDKLTERITRFAADDRLAGKKDEVAPMLGHYLNLLIDACEKLDHQLTQGE